MTSCLENFIQTIIPTMIEVVTRSNSNLHFDQPEQTNNVKLHLRSVRKYVKLSMKIFKPSKDHFGGCNNFQGCLHFQIHINFLDCLHFQRHIYFLDCLHFRGCIFVGMLIFGDVYIFGNVLCFLGPTSFLESSSLPSTNFNFNLNFKKM